MLAVPFEHEATCRHCGGELFSGEAGMVCCDCGARIIPTPIYRASLNLPICWRNVRKLTQRTFRKWWSGMGESRQRRDREQARIGLRQTMLF